MRVDPLSDLQDAILLQPKGSTGLPGCELAGGQPGQITGSIPLVKKSRARPQPQTPPAGSTANHTAGKRLKDKEQAGKDRLQADKDREQALKDKEQAGKDRLQADKDRAQAMLDREQAKKDRAQADLDRKQADKDRQQADEDRKFVKSLVDDLVKEKLVESSDALTSLELDDTRLLINGKEQPQPVHSRFQAKYLQGKHTRISYRNSGTSKTLSVD